MENAFAELGISQRESSVYTALLELGTTSALKLSRYLHLPRATVYLTLDSLAEKALIRVDKRNRARALYSAHAPIALSALVERERDALSRKERVAQELIEQLAPLTHGARGAAPSVEMHEGKRAVEKLLYDMLPHWRASIEATDNTLWGYQDPTFVEQYRRWHDHLWSTRSSEEKICLFSNRSNVEQELRLKVPNREVRPLPEGTHFRSSIWLYGDYVLLGNTREKPHYALHFKNTIFASNLRTIFQLLWKARFD